MAILSTGLEKLQHFALAPTAERTANLNGTAVDMNDYEGDLVIVLDVENWWHLDSGRENPVERHLWWQLHRRDHCVQP
jgi:hypothetical protein